MLVALLWLIVSTSGIVGGDSSRRLQIAHSWLTGEKEIVFNPETYKPNSRLDVPGVIGRDGNLYYGDELGQSILMLPGDWLGIQIHKLFPKKKF